MLPSTIFCTQQSAGGVYVKGGEMSVRKKISKKDSGVHPQVATLIQPSFQNKK